MHALQNTFYSPRALTLLLTTPCVQQKAHYKKHLAKLKSLPHLV
ncbi:hypothetical protein HHE02_10330 [Helicobacter heilmannii]|uniref:Uncharacterized protein n=1 Tax=Helicobacter heilmannii TaxID=35817 RepID=A0A0K2XMI4_HELHE|nr:hypothetical protein BN341_16520 [Helicobacter heilmannii ASB1.4]CRF47738.1 hypothetical protein HHE02_10330 [Helicobacter heilmannii]CRF50829.1 hypothetical protein HHE06_06820 [Helicobacter heilmannii]CRI35223.1 hypothetical protein HHE01_02210 [Helicobacter heilmannii]